MKHYNFKTAMLNLFVECLGRGFSGVVSVYTGIKSNNFKQKMFKMNQGDNTAYSDILRGLRWTFEPICGGFYDEKSLFCDSDTLAKYDEINFNLFSNFEIFALSDENFFYENDEDVLAYLTAKWLIKVLERSSQQQSWAVADYHTEYWSTFYDVFINSMKNKTFYKWAIDEFYSGVGNRSEADKIIGCVFGLNFGKPNSTFEKLKYEQGERNWGTFEKLFKNEHKNDQLIPLLQNANTLKSYQIFQARMFAAYFLENLRSVLPDFVGKKNSDEFWDLLRKFAKNTNSKIDPKKAFLSPNYDAQTKAYADSVHDLFYEYDCRNFMDGTVALDLKCPATALFSSLVKLKFASRCTPNPISKLEENRLLSECRKSAKYYGEFRWYGGFELDGILW